MNNSSQYDVIVVGSGLSALVFAALAAQSGERVLVLEAHEHPGGFGHTFSMGKSARFNAQFHYVWNCGPGETVHNVLTELGLADSVTFEQLEPEGFDRMCIPGHEIFISSNNKTLTQRLAYVAPEAASSIERFLRRVELVAEGLDFIASAKTPGKLLTDGYKGAVAARYLNSTLQDVFNEFRLPQVVQSLLASQWPDFLLPPRDLSFFAWVMLFTGYQRGAYYPTHHFEHVIESLVKHIEANGGCVKLNHLVTAFHLSEGRATGVSATNLENNAEAHFDAATVVSNIDPRKTADMIGRHLFNKKMQKKFGYEYSPSNFMIYCTVKDLDLRSHGFGNWNTFHCGDTDINQAFDRMYRAHDYSNPSFAITTPGLITYDKSDRADGEEIVEILTVADYEYFEALGRTSRRDYLAKKREIVETIFDVVEAHYIPDFRRHVNFKISGTPTTNERFCWAPAGNSYGANMTPYNISLGRVPTSSGIPGLYFCNATAGFPGFAGSFWNGQSLYRQLYQ